MPTINVSSYLPSLLGPVAIKVAGVDQEPRATINFTGCTAADDGEQLTIAASVGSTPTGTGLRKVVSGTEAAAAALLVDADVNASAAIAGTKISPVFTALLAGARGIGFEVLTEAGAGPFNDYAIGNYSVLYVTGNSTFTGFVPPAGGRAHVLFVCCPTANTITLSNLTGSTAAYQIALEGNAPSVSASGFLMIYVPGATKWKLMAYPQF
jgi:hypothetical protein